MKKSPDTAFERYVKRLMKRQVECPTCEGKGCGYDFAFHTNWGCKNCDGQRTVLWRKSYPFDFAKKIKAFVEKNRE